MRMEINGCPFYIKSKNNVPYIYDVDTHDEVGYWSSKKGAYVMFSLYNKLMNDLRKKKETESSAGESESSLDEEGEQEEGEEGDEEEGDEEDEEDEEEEGEEGEDEEGEEGEDEEEEECEESKTNADVVDSIQEKLTTNYSIVMLFVILFIYLILQKELQSIYFDFVFIILINLLNTLKTFEILNDE